jgi:hypothetical protein
MRAQLASIQVFLSVIAVTGNGFDLALLSQLPGTAQLFGPSGLVCRVSRGESDGGARRCLSIVGKWIGNMQVRTPETPVTGQKTG